MYAARAGLPCLISSPPRSKNFNEQKEFNKIEREIKDLEYAKKQIENLFSEGKVADAAITAKAKELEVIIKKLEEKEARWFELSSKMDA